jgi:1,4-dihydroxy-2-naphthoyl-CoA synthase
VVAGLKHIDKNGEAPRGELRKVLIGMPEWKLGLCGAARTAVSQPICFATEDAKEGRNAFKQKRTARFNRR